MKKESWSVAEWRDRVASVPGKLWEVDAGLPVRMYYGSNDKGQYSFGFISDVEPSAPAFSSAISTNVSQRTVDQRWALTFVLQQPQLLSVFMQFCVHMYARVSSASTVYAALASVDETISEWVRLFRTFRGDRLGLREMRGLFAELYFGFRILEPTAPAEHIVSSWDGPFGFDQDFNFNTSSCEVKSRKPGAKSVLISNEFQLSGPNVYLAVLAVSDFVSPTEGAISLPELIDSILDDLSSEGRNRFELALLEAGIQREDDYYGRFFFAPGELRIYHVSKDFPRISVDMLSEGVSRVRYALSLDAIATFSRELDDIPVSVELIDLED